MADSATPAPMISHGRGAWLYDDQGNSYLDGCSGAIVCNLGHGNAEIIEAQAAQGRRISFVFGKQLQSKPRQELRRAILDRCPGYAEVLFCNSGSEAIESAVRLSRLYWQARGQPTRTHILSRTISYHGITEGALRLSGHNDRRQQLLAPGLSQPLVPTSYCFRCPFMKTPATCDLACADELDRWIARIGRPHVAGFLIEPVVGASGAAISAPDAYFERVHRIATSRDVLLIADEIMTGFGRLGAWLGLDRWGVTADLTVIGKGLGAGYTPISALLVSTKVWDSITARPDVAEQIFGHTYSGNPVSCATALEVMRQIEVQGVLGNVLALAPILRDHLRAIAAEFPSVLDVRGEGFLWGLELAGPGQASTLTVTALKSGLLIYPCRSFLGVGAGEAVLIAPPLNCTRDEIDELSHRLRRAFLRLHDREVL